MMKKCNGCGAFFQSENKEQEGYIRLENIEKSDICERCFRIKNYGDYKNIEKKNEDFIPILQSINDTNDLVVLLVDIFHMNQDLSLITKYIKNDILLVFTKRDILPLSISDESLLSYNDYLKIHCIDKMIISSLKNYELDLLMEKIKKYKKGNDVYVVGYTNAGKSSLINKLIYNYSSLERELTTSILPSTTIHTIEIPLQDNLVLIDTPGILEEGSIIEQVDFRQLKRILPRKEIKPITYQIKSKQFVCIDSLAIVESENNNLTFFISNELKIDRTYKDIKDKYEFKENIVRVKKGEDIVILGLGFIKVMKDEIITVYTLPNVSVYTRKSLI